MNEPQLSEQEMRDRIDELVVAFFNDPTKSDLWFTTKNPLLGYVTPNQMLELGRVKQLYKFVTEALAGI